MTTQTKTKLTLSELKPNESYEIHYLHKRCQQEKLKHFYHAIHSNEYFELYCPICNLKVKIWNREEMKYVEKYYTKIE